MAVMVIKDPIRDEERRINLDWLTSDVIRNAIRESEEHPTRVAFINQSKRCWKYYLANTKSFSPYGDEDKEDDAMKYPISSENRIKKSVNDEISILLKNNPIVRHYPHPERPNDGDLADHMDEILAATWRPDGANMANLIQATLQEAIVSGLGIQEIFWDPSKRMMARGDVSGEKVPHKDIFLDVFATNDKRGLDCRYIVRRKWFAEDKIRSMFDYDGKIPKVKKGVFGGRWSRFAGFFKGDLNRPLMGGEREDQNQQYEKKIALYEAWLFPTVKQDWEQITGETIEEKDFPFGIIATMLEDTIVDIRPNPNATDKIMQEEPTEQDINAGIQPSQKNHIIGSKRHPFNLMYWQATADEDGNNRIYCAEGAVASMICPQVAFNSLSRYIHINAITFANPAKIAVDGALKNLPPNNMTAEPGAIYVEDARFAGRGIRNLEGSQLPAYVFELRNLKGEAIREMGGLNLLMTGVGNPSIGTSHMPGRTLEGLQGASIAPLYTPIQELTRAIYDMSVLIEGLMQQHYEPGRFIEVSDKGERQYIQWQEANILANFNRVVVSGSTTPMDDIERERKVAEITAVANQALATNDKYLILSTILFLKNLNKAYAYDWIQLLQRKIAEIDAIQNTLQQVGMSEVGQQMQSAQQMPTEPQDGDIENMLAELQSELGRG